MTIELGALIILAITNIGTLAYHAWSNYLENKERSKTINALIAKSSQEYLNHEMADKLESVKPQETIPEVPPDFQEISELSDEEFDKKILSR